MVFDPGIYLDTGLDNDLIDSLDLVSQIFKLEFPQHQGRCPVVVFGDVQVDNNFVVVDNILFDSGAMQASYMSKQWRACRERVRLAGNQTIVDISERFRT